MHIYVHPSIIYNSQDMEATSVSIDRRNKEVVAYVPHMYTQRHTHTGILLLNHKKEWNLPISDDMDRPRVILLSDKVRQRNIWFHLYVESNKQNRETQRYREQTGGHSGEGMGDWAKQVKGIKK